MDRIQRAFNFCFGTWPRARVSLIVLGVALLFVPGVPGKIADKLTEMLAPFIGIAIILLILGLAFGRIFGPVYRLFFPKKKKD